MLRRTLCPVLVGRADERSALDAALESARQGLAGAVLVAGDAGIGKTRLIEDFGDGARRRGVPCFWGGCSETGLQVPYLPFVEALQGHLRLEARGDPELAALVGRSVSDDDPSERRLRIFDALLRHLADAAAPAGAVLALEDLHWSDAGTRDLLDYVIRSLSGTRLLVIGTYRADEVGRGHPLLPMTRAWVRRGLAQFLELEPLGEAAVREMLEATIAATDPVLARRLHARSEGNPFVLEEILQSGDLEAVEALPATVVDTILARVDRLDGATREALRAAAIAGDPIDDRVLSELLGDRVADALETCANQQLLTPQPDGTYRWRHAITRAAVHQQMSAERRRRLHSDLADVYLRRAADDATICGHLAAAERWQEAIPRGRRAAASAAAVGAFADAARVLELCVPHIESPEERPEVLQELAELLVQSGLPELGEPNAREAVAIREREGDRVALVAARRTLAASLWQQTRWAEAIVLEDRTIADLEPHGPSPELVSALARRASSNMLAEGDIPRAVEMVARAREMAVQNGYDARLYDADEGQVLATAGEVESGLRILDDSWRARLRSPRHSGDRREGRFLLHHAVALRNLMGRTAESLAILAEYPPVPHAQDSADVSLAVVQAEALWAHGEIARARAVFDSLDLARLEHNVVPWVQCVRSELLFAAGELAAAAASARTAMPRHWQPTSHIRAAWEIRILVSAGDVQHALELAGRIQSVRSYGADFVLPLLDAAVEAHLAAGDVATAERLAKWAAGTLATNPYRSRIRGLRQMADGDPAGASSSFRASAVAFLATGHRQNEWHSRRLLANALQATGQRAAADAELRLVEREIADAGGTSPLGKPVLSRREREVAWLVAQGMRNREIGARLFISERTVENHIHRILERTQLRSRAELAAYVTRLGAELSGIPE